MKILVTGTTGYPIHRWIFRGKLRAIQRQAEESFSLAASSAIQRNQRGTERTSRPSRKPFVTSISRSPLTRMCKPFRKPFGPLIAEWWNS